MRLAATVVCTAFFGLLSMNAHARPWKASDLSTIRAINEVQISPDGSKLTYDVGVVNVKTDSFSDSFFVADLRSRRTRKLLAKPLEIAHPRWSPDSRRIAGLVPAKDGAVQLWLVSPDGRAHQLTHSGQIISAFAWSPNGKQIAVVQSKKPEPQAKHSYVWMNPQSDILTAGPPAARTVWLVDVRTGAMRRLVVDSYSYGSPAQSPDPSWSADSSQIALVRQPTPYFGDYEREEYVSVDASSGAVKSLTTGNFFALPSTTPPVYSPAGNRAALVHTWDGRLAAREDIFLDGVNISAAFDHDFWSCAGTQMSWAGDSLLASTMDGVDMRLYRFAPGRTEPQALTPAGGSVEGFSSSVSGNVVAFIYSTSSHPQELFTMNADGSSRRQVTNVQHLPADLTLAKTVAIHWKSDDGHLLVGQLTVPDGASANTPFVLEPHGGPQCADDSGFSASAQYFATNGYSYFRPSPRGSDGYGDWSYKAIVNDFGEVPMRDVMAGIDAVISRGIANRNRIFVEGGSYGGYLTSWLVTHTNRFHAAVAQVPVTDIALDYALSESPNITKRFFGQNPLQRNQENMALQSPQHYAASMNTPLLIMSGLKDTRAPYPQAIEFYKTLLEFGKPVRMLGYPEEGHGPEDPLGIMDWFQHTAGWFAAHDGLPIPDALLPDK